MYSDGEHIYFLVQYRQKSFNSPIVKTVCEVYEIDDERKMKRIREVPLYKDSECTNYYKGSRKTKDHGGHMARGSMACNGEVLMWFSSHALHIYNLDSGARV